MSSLKVPLEKIGPEGFDLDERLEQAWLEETFAPGTQLSAVTDGRLTVHLNRVQDVVHVRGRLHVPLRAPCGRCLEPLDVVVDTTIEVALFPAGKEPEAAPDGELTEEDLGVGTYAGEEIDLVGLVRDEVFLELPMNPVCSYAKAEECPNYRRNVGEQPLAEPAADEGPDPRWAALSRIKLS